MALPGGDRADQRVCEATAMTDAGPAPLSSEDTWEDVSLWWQDNFSQGADPEYEEQILPLITDLVGDAGRVLEVGTGEGQVTRSLARARPGRSVIGMDPTRNQVVAAVERVTGWGAGVGAAPAYARAGAEHLPVASGSMDAVVACLVFEHIDDVDGAIAEVARVLADGGRFVFLLNHPLIQTPDSGWIDDQVIDPPEQYWRVGPYLPEAETIEQVEKGVFIRFLHRPLSRYVNALADHGLYIERMIEPAPPPGFVARAPEYEEAATIPRLLALVARRFGERQGRS
jgi:ubiquinone/menaquinone biosynthesis C-methylase UbiE